MEEKLRVLKQLFREKPYLCWYVKDVTLLSLESMVEHVLNYGSWGDVMLLINTIGIKAVSKVFFEKSSGGRTNYRPKVKHFFSLFFNANA